jgi:hypothetical protein
MAKTGRRDALKPAAAARAQYHASLSKEVEARREGGVPFNLPLLWGADPRELLFPQRFSSLGRLFPSSWRRSRRRSGTLADSCNHIPSRALVQWQTDTPEGPWDEMTSSFLHRDADGWTRACQQRRPCQVSNYPRGSRTHQAPKPRDSGLCGDERVCALLFVGLVVMKEDEAGG